MLSSLGTYDFTDYSNLLTKVEETDAKVSELVQYASVFDILEVADTNRDKFVRFFKDVRIYGNNVPRLSVWNIRRSYENGNNISFVYQDASVAGYYINYKSNTEDNYIRVQKDDGTIIDMYVDWTVLENDTSISDENRRNRISESCYYENYITDNNIENNVRKSTLYDTFNLKPNVPILDFIKGIRIYSENLYELSFFYCKRSSTEGNSLQIVYYDPSTSSETYYINTKNLTDDNYICITRPDGDVIELYVNWETLNDGDSIADYNRNNRLSPICFNKYVGESLRDMKSKLYNIEERFVIKGEKKSYVKVLEGCFINDKGIIEPTSNNSFKVYMYPIIADTEYILYSTLRIGIAHLYAIYTSEDASSSVEVGPPVTDDRDDYIIVKVPSGGAYIAISTFNNSDFGLFDSKIKSISDVYDDFEISDNNGDRLAVTLDINGEDLYIAYLDFDNIEYVYWFKKCMFNELYTFYRVGYRQTDRNKPSTEGIKTLDGIVLINKTDSDNIGPVSFKEGGWVGGNHSYLNDGITKTARCDSYSIFLSSNREINAGETIITNRVMIKVVNTLFNPAIAPTDGSDTLSVPIANEIVNYLVSNNNIEVSIKIDFVSTSNPLNHYYGMQSMCHLETEILTPNGLYPDWTSVVDTSFVKSEYPKFNRFIERNTNYDYYQASYLIPNKDGNHNMVTKNIFTRATGKSYHTIVDDSTLFSNSKIVWSGVYTFFKNPLINDDNILAYYGRLYGHDCIYISTKKEFDKNIELPAKFMFREIEFVEKDDIISTDNMFTDADGVHIKSSGIGSCIILLR